jgi:hypothetical protein
LTSAPDPGFDEESSDNEAPLFGDDHDDPDLTPAEIQESPAIRSFASHGPSSQRTLGELKCVNPRANCFGQFCRMSTTRTTKILALAD